MPLSLSDQAALAIQGISYGDVDMVSKLLTDPDAVTIDDQRTAAERLGVKKGFLSAAVNTFSDPVVWMAFLMSRRFPTLSWLKGTIPQRFIGTANEFTGVSQFTRPVENYFRGTNIPRLTSLKMLREAEVMKVGTNVFQLMERPGWKDEMPIVSTLLEGQSHPDATPELRQLAVKIRQGMHEGWNMLAQTKRITGGFEGDQITMARSEDWKANEAPVFLRDYLPHIPLLGAESTIETSGAMALRKMGLGRVRQAMEARGINPGQVWSVDASDRLSSDFGRYQAFLNDVSGQVYNPRLFRRQRLNIPLQSMQGQELFVTDLNLILQKYFHGLARTYANNAPLSELERAMAATKVLGEDGIERTVFPTNEPIIVQIINQGLKTAGFTTRQRPVAGTRNIEEIIEPGSGSPLMLTALRDLTRAVQGKADEGEIIWGNLFSSIANKFERTARNLTKQGAADVDYALKTVRHNQQYRTLANGVTSYFYGTTLGLNPWSAIQNMLQPVLTTMPAIGVGPTLRGMREMGSRVGRYSSELRSEYNSIRASGREFFGRLPEAADRAMAKVFPELARAGLKIDPRLFDVDPNSTVATGRFGRAFRHYDDFAKWIMQPFTHAEMSNQITTFYGARSRLRDAIKTGELEVPIGVNGKPLMGADLDTWMDFDASNVVNSTQFRPGPGGRTIFQGRLPAPLRMFTSFPVRAMSFMMESTVRGAMTQAQIGNAGLLDNVLTLGTGRNLGTLARMLLYGRIAQNGARDVLGIDISNALGITAPMISVPPGQPFAPLPIPPIASTAYGLLSAATTRDIKRMQPMSIPGIGEIPVPRSLIPGGLGITRVARAMQQYQPDLGGFVDDDERLMYRGNTTDMLLSALGVPTDKGRRLRNAMERIQANRGAIRDYRRRFAMAAINGDTGQMDGLSASYRKAFPDLPPLTVAQKDIRRYQQNAMLPQISRMVRTMGSAGSYLEADIYDVDPDLVAPPEFTNPLAGLLRAG